MDLDIRKDIYKNIKGSSKEELLSILNESVNQEDEMSLPGLGVLLELFWESLDLNDKKKIIDIMIKELKKL